MIIFYQRNVLSEDLSTWGLCHSPLTPWEISSHDKLMEAKPNCKSHFTLSENSRFFFHFHRRISERESYKFYCIANMLHCSTEQINNHILMVGVVAALLVKYKYNKTRLIIYTIYLLDFWSSTFFLIENQCPVGYLNISEFFLHCGIMWYNV